MRLIQNIKNIAKSSLVVILATGIIYAAWVLTKLDSWAPITKENWDAMVDEITALKVANTNLQNQIDSISASTQDWTLEEKWSIYINSGYWKDWTITGLTKNKPAFISIKWQESASRDHLYYRAVSWTLNALTQWDDTTYYVGSGNWYYGSSVGMIVPTEETVVIRIKWHWTGHVETAVMYQ
jgi:hypothetical protein